MKSDDLAIAILDYDIQFYAISLCISELLMNTQVSCNQKIMLSACESHKETMSKVNRTKSLDMWERLCCNYQTTFKIIIASTPSGELQRNAMYL